MKAVIFDADGVLYDGETTSHIAGYRILKELNPNMTVSCGTISNALVGIRVNKQQDVLQNLFAELNQSIIFPDEYIKEVDKKQMDIFENEPFTSIDGIIETLDFLQASNIPFFIGSRSRIHTMNKKIEKSGLRKYFPEENVYYPEKIDGMMWEEIENYRQQHLSISAEQLKKDKAGVFLNIALQNELDPENCIVLEDTIGGLESAINANMRALGIALTPSAKTHLAGIKTYPVCKTKEQIPTALKSFLAE